MEAPLSGLRVLELGGSVAGPSAGRLLGDLGAEVFKVEPPEGDQLRTWGHLAPDGTSWWFKSHNRNKRLLAFDLRDEAQCALVRRIALACDVVLENMRPGALEAKGLGAESLRTGAAVSEGVIHLGFIHDFNNFEASVRTDLLAIETIGGVLAGTGRRLRCAR